MVVTERRPVLVGIREGDPDTPTLAWAAAYAARHALPLRLVHALDLMPRATKLRRGGDPGEAWVDRFFKEGDDVLERAHEQAGAHRPGITIEAVLADGSPLGVLRAEAADASLVVLGSRHLNTVEELLTTGRIAVPLAAHATCPVAVIREPERPFDPGAVGTGPPILVGVDGSADSAHAVGFAFQEAAARGVPVTAAYVCRPSPSIVAPVTTGEAVENARLQLSETLAGWTERHPDVVVRQEVAFGHPVRILADRSRDALALVVGNRGRGGFTGMLLGSVSSGLIHHARCPLVVTHAPGA